MQHASVNIVVALACEAKPIIERLKLKRRHGNYKFSLFESRDSRINLVVSGIGRYKSAVATTYLQALTGFNPAAQFINIGIAGAQLAAIGELYFVNKLTELTQKKCFYPDVPSRIRAMPLLTVAKPTDTYPEDTLIDMEGYGFYAAANTFVDREYIHLLKVVSDNQQNSTQKINQKFVSDLITKHLILIDEFVASRLKIAEHESDLTSLTKYYQVFIDKFHFSYYQSHQLQELLRRWHVNFPDRDPLAHCHDCENGKMVLETLDKTLAEASYHWI